MEIRRWVVVGGGGCCSQGRVGEIHAAVAAPVENKHRRGVFKCVAQKLDVGEAAPELGRDSSRAGAAVGATHLVVDHPVEPEVHLLRVQVDGKSALLAVLGASERLQGLAHSRPCFRDHTAHSSNVDCAGRGCIGRRPGEPRHRGDGRLGRGYERLRLQQRTYTPSPSIISRVGHRIRSSLWFTDDQSVAPQLEAKRSGFAAVGTRMQKASAFEALVHGQFQFFPRPRCPRLRATRRRFTRTGSTKDVVPVRVTTRLCSCTRH